MNENKVIAFMGTISSVVIGWKLFSAEMIDWAGIYLLGLLVIGLIVHVKHNVIGV